MSLSCSSCHACQVIADHGSADTFRSNVADGNVAIEVQLTPGDVFPEECISREMGDHRIPATRQMRRMRASDYALRLAILLAASAFRASGLLRNGSAVSR